MWWGIYEVRIIVAEVMVVVHDSLGNGLKKAVERGCAYEVQTHKRSLVEVLGEGFSGGDLKLLELLLSGLIRSSESPMFGTRENVGLHDKW
jgi:hypothetical protein